MSTGQKEFSKSQFYTDYKASLAKYSKCVKPIIEASYEKYFINPFPGSDRFNLEDYCIYERGQVEHFRNLIKQEFQLQ
jgi:hypothetical protein